MKQPDRRLLADSNDIRRQASELVDLRAPVHTFMLDILNHAHDVLDVSRISIWLLKEAETGKQLECVTSTDWNDNNIPEVAPALNEADFPAYFQAIEHGLPIIAHNAETDERTHEFLIPYLIPNNIKSMLDTIIYNNGTPSGVVCCEQMGDFRKWQREEVHFAEVLSDCCTYRFMAQKQAKLEYKLEQMVFIDDLTKLYNRRYFFDAIENLCSYHCRNHIPLSIAIIDLDNFKVINDNHGHLAGDKILKSFAAISVNIMRREDTICRYGGEEFIITFLGLSVEKAKAATDRILEKVIQSPVIYDNIEIPYSFSAGVCEIDCKLPITASIKNADAALYKAKELGKKRVEVFN